MLRFTGRGGAFIILPISSAISYIIDRNEILQYNYVVRPAVIIWAKHILLTLRPIIKTLAIILAAVRLDQKGQISCELTTGSLVIA